MNPNFSLLNCSVMVRSYYDLFIIVNVLKVRKKRSVFYVNMKSAFTKGFI